MSTSECPDLDLLFTELSEGSGASLEHAKGCEDCSEILKEHRALERQLFQLSDPFPPSSFVPQVMARVAAQPAPTYHELRVGLTILFAAFGFSLGALVVGGGFGQLGTFAASALVHGQTFFVGLNSAISALWSTAALPMVVSLSLVLFATLFALKRLFTGGFGFSEVKISS